MSESEIEPRWLDADQQRSWRALVLGTTLLFDRLDDDLRRHCNVSLTEYEILVRLSERNGQMRMAQLADALAHSRSRVTHTIRRMEKAGLVVRAPHPTTVAGSSRRSPTRARQLLRDAARRSTSTACATTWSTCAATRTSPRSAGR